MFSSKPVRNYFPLYLMDPNGVREAPQKTLIFIVGLHEEVEVFPGLYREQTQETRKINLT